MRNRVLALVSVPILLGILFLLLGLGSVCWVLTQILSLWRDAICSDRPGSEGSDGKEIEPSRGQSEADAASSLEPGGEIRKGSEGSDGKEIEPSRGQPEADAPNSLEPGGQIGKGSEGSDGNKIEPSPGQPEADAASSLEPGGQIGIAHPENYENYDVFLSHRGPDTKVGVVRELHEAFKRAGLRSFMDFESIRVGQRSWDCIEDALRKSPIAVVIFSKNFAQSQWCLKELHVIMNTPSIRMIPIFFEVRPWEVQLPADLRSKEEFKELSKSSDSDIDSWREDLAKASLVMGYIHDGGKSSGESRHDLVTKIVAKVCELSDRSAPLHMGLCFGVVQQAEKIIRHLDSNPEVKMLGLWGSGGIGKTTLGKGLYNQLCQYAATYFAEDVKEKISVGGVTAVLSAMLENLCNSESTYESKGKSGLKSLLKLRLKDKKILLVLDDVVDNVMLEDLISHDMLSEGSLCIVTSRNKAVLSIDNKSNHIHEVLPLSFEDAKETLAAHVFEGDYQASLETLEPKFQTLFDKIGEACLGIPIILVVIGRHLKECGKRDFKIWNETLKQLKKSEGIMGFDRIFKCLEISYRSLKLGEQELFLDVACALLGEDVHHALRVWKAEGRELIRASVEVLKSRALITVDEMGRFGMHDHLRDLGREIVEKQYKNDRICKRMWMPKSRNHWISCKPFPESLETLVLIWSKRDCDGILDFSRLTRLRILVCGGYPVNLVSIPTSLLMLSWSIPVIPKRNSLMDRAPENSMLTELPRAREDSVVVRDDEPGCISSETFFIGTEIQQSMNLEALDLRGPNSNRPVRLAEELWSSENLSVIRLERCGRQLDKLEYLGLEWCGDRFTRGELTISNFVPLRKLEIWGADDFENLTNLIELKLVGTKSKKRSPSLPRDADHGEVDQYVEGKLPPSKRLKQSHLDSPISSPILCN